MDQIRPENDQTESRTRAAEVILLGTDDYRAGLLRIQNQLLPSAIRPYFQALLERHALSSSEAVRRANLDKDFGRQIMTGERMARRDYYIQLAFGIGLSFNETQSMLNFLGIGPIYAIWERDAAIGYALENGYRLMDAQLLLDEHGLPVLGDPDVEDGDVGGAFDPLPTREAEQYVREARDYGELTDRISGRFARLGVSAYFGNLLKTHGLTRKQAIERAGLIGKQNLAFQLLNGTRTAKNRDLYIRLAFGIGLSLEETQRMLKFLKKGALYPLKERDAALVFCIGHGYSLSDTQKLLANNALPEI